jgi:hypothetical protein
MSLTSPSQNIPYEMRIKQLQGRIMAAAKLANPTLREFSGMDYQESAYLTRRLGQMDIVVQPPTNPRYVVSRPGAGTESVTGNPPDPLSDLTVSATYSPPLPYSIRFDMAFDISWTPVPFSTSVNVSMDYGPSRLPINDFESAFSFDPTTETCTGVSNYTDSGYNDINVTLTVANAYGQATTVVSGINPAT